MMRTDIRERRDDILRWISENKSHAYMCQQFKCKPDTLKRVFQDWGITYKGNQGSKGRPHSNKKSALEYLNSSCVKTYVLKLKLLDDEIKERKCEICDNDTWLGKPIPLELDHIDGDNTNNDLENLRIVCPNCHSMQPTNSGKNARLKRINRSLQCAYGETVAAPDLDSGFERSGSSNLSTRTI